MVLRSMKARGALRVPGRKAKPEETPAPPVIAKPGGKGRATPSRKEAQSARRESPTARTTGGKGGATSGKSSARDARRAQTQSYRAAMLSGDVNKLPPRERAPERVLVRELVDSRRNFGPVFLAVLVLNFVSSIVPSATVRTFTTLLLLVALAIFVLDAFLVARSSRAAVQKRHPGSKVAVAMYAVQRSILPGRWRMPRPQHQVAGFLPVKYRQIGRR